MMLLFMYIISEYTKESEALQHVPSRVTLFNTSEILSSIWHL